VTLEEHVSCRAFALGLSNREILCVTPSSTFRVGRSPTDPLTGSSWYGPVSASQVLRERTIGERETVMAARAANMHSLPSSEGGRLKVYF
jgi:hypothetical protein